MQQINSGLVTTNAAGSKTQLVDERQREIQELEEPMQLLEAPILHSKRSDDDLYL